MLPKQMRLNFGGLDLVTGEHAEGPEVGVVPRHRVGAPGAGMRGCALCSFCFFFHVFIY